MSRIILPASVEYNVERERMARRHAGYEDFNRQLRELDEDAELVKAHDGAAAPGIVPGYWHVKRVDPETQWEAYIALKGPDGEFSDPHSGHLEMLRQADLQRSGGWEALQRRLDREEEQRTKEQAWVRAEFREEFAERYLNKTRPSVSFTPVSSGWRNKASAPRA